MKKHVLWLAFAVAAFVLGTAWMMRRKPAPPALTPRDVSATTPAAPRFAPPAGNQAAPLKPVPLVAIEDGKTIDFSKGLAIVRDGEKEKAALEKALKEIEVATRDVSFTTKPVPPPPEKK